MNFIMIILIIILLIKIKFAKLQFILTLIINVKNSFSKYKLNDLKKPAY